jgi:Ca2+-binding RTX toxin-like protein
MPTYRLQVYAFDPLGTIPQNAGTFTWNGPATATGNATITDNEAGIQGLTLDSNVAGGETATATVTINGNTSTNASVYAEEVWQVRDTVTNEIFEVTTLRVDAGAAAGWYTISEVPLVAGRSYQMLQSDYDPDATQGDLSFGLDQYIGADRTITGTNANNTINTAYADAQGDRVDDGFSGGVGGNDNIINALGGNDTVNAGLGDDTIDGGTGNDSLTGGVGNDSIIGGLGNDTLIGGADNDTLDGGDGNDSLSGGAGSDSVSGGAGNDTLLGGGGTDTILGGDNNDLISGDGGNDTLNGGGGNDTIFGNSDGPDPVSTTEVLDWSLAGGDGTNVAGGVTQVVGGVEVNVSFTNTGNNNPTFLIETSDPNFVDAGEDFDPNSALRLFGNGDAATSRTRIDFTGVDGGGMSDEVENVSFRLSDIDSAVANHIDTITINAFDAAGNPVAVTITPEGDDTVSGNTITAGPDLDDPIDANGSALVEIAGPVAYFEIIYTNGLNLTHAVLVSDVFFDTIPAPDDDLIDGGTGADVIDGGIGEDTITGGAGDDTLTGGAGDDVFVIDDGFGADVITDFDIADDDSNGFFNDQLDVSALTDAFGNPVNVWDVTVSDDGIGNALLTFPNGETIVLQGVAPAAVTGAQLLNAAGVPCFTEGTFIRTPRGEIPVEALKLGDRVLTLDNGAQEIRWIGKRSLGPRELLAQPELKPICIPQGVMGNYAPLFVSPQHAMLLNDPASPAPDTTVLARAKHLAEMAGPIRVAHGKKQVTYIHLMFDAHQVIFANGAATESFYPGRCALDMFPASVLKEIADVVPALRHQPAEAAYGPTARPMMKRKDVLKLRDLHQAMQGFGPAESLQRTRSR